MLVAPEKVRGIPNRYRGQYGGISPIDKGSGGGRAGGMPACREHGRRPCRGDSHLPHFYGRRRLRQKGAVGLRHRGWIENRGFRMKSLGRAGQMLGLTLPCLAVLLELMHAISLGQMLVMLVAAVCCFWIGRIIEGYGN